MIVSMKNSSDTFGNGTRDLVVCSAVPQPTAPPAACPEKVGYMTFKIIEVSPIRLESPKGNFLKNLPNFS